ncbi:hypothetical protein ACLBXM_02640 [Xanthobacteraceae bacterium A53D]
MQLVTQAAFDAASADCDKLVALSLSPQDAIAEAMVTTGLALMVRERGAGETAAFAMQLLHLALREEAARGH